MSNTRCCLASLYIPSQENKGPHPSPLISQQESPQSMVAPEMAGHHKEAPHLKIHGRGETYRGVEVYVLWFEKLCFLHATEEPSHVDFPGFLILSGSILVVMHVREQVFLPNHPHDHPHQCLILLSSRSHHLLFCVCVFFKFLFKV